MPHYERKSAYKGNIPMNQVIVVTGASSGFGALTARELARAGHIVYASMRETAGRNAPQVGAVKQFAAENRVDLRPVELDVASEASSEEAIWRIVEENGRLDVVVHNAGHMVFGPAEAFTPGQLAHLYDINVPSDQLGVCRRISLAGTALFFVRGARLVFQKGQSEVIPLSSCSAYCCFSNCIWTHIKTVADTGELTVIGWRIYKSYFGSRFVGSLGLCV